MDNKKIKHQYTLDETWELCLAMWKWVAEHYDPYDKKGKGWDCVNTLKDDWLKENGYGAIYLKHDCFFCQYASEEGEILIREEANWPIRSCPTCPAIAMSKPFHCENYNSYVWHNKPKQFYRKLLSLYERYKKKTIKNNIP